MLRFSWSIGLASVKFVVVAMGKLSSRTSFLKHLKRPSRRTCSIQYGRASVIWWKSCRWEKSSARKVVCRERSLGERRKCLVMNRTSCVYLMRFSVCCSPSVWERKATRYFEERKREERRRREEKTGQANVSLWYKPQIVFNCIIPNGREERKKKNRT